MLPTGTPEPILLVEDNADDELLTLHAFKENKIPNEIVVARDGVEALNYLLGTAPLPAIVLLDLKLPKLNGLEVLERVRANTRTRCLPIIVLTTSREEADLLKCYSLGANSYIQKPVDLKHFIEAIHHVGAYWLKLNCPPPLKSA
ncbi:MAG TPA: response regulator [Planctomycetota bacterium]|nr:response regulator [Planctomycetota bacterium]